MPFLLRRAVHALVLLAGSSILSFTILNLAPGDFFDEIRINPEVSSATVAALRSEHGLNRSLPSRYLSWVKSVAEGDWGFSFAYHGPARPILLARAGNTLLLTVSATLLAWAVAIPLGMWAATSQGKLPDLLTGGLISTLLATPELVLGLLFLLLAVRTGLFPVGGLTSAYAPVSSANLFGSWVQIEDVGKHLILPSICLAAGLLPLLTLHIRAAIREVLQTPYAAAALGHGIPFRRVLLRHVLPAAANPLISLFGLSLGMLMSSSLVTEAIFSWPGLGRLTIEAIQQRDLFLVLDTGMLATCFLLIGNLVADVLLAASDPRIRAE